MNNTTATTILSSTAERISSIRNRHAAATGYRSDFANLAAASHP